MSNGLLHFGVSSIWFQAIEMYSLPLSSFYSLINHISDLTRSANNLERTVPMKIELSGLRVVKFGQPN